MALLAISLAAAYVLISLSADLPAGALIDRFAGSDLALSPDGARIILSQSDPSGNFRLVMRQLDQGQFVPLSGVERGYMPFFSPDSRWIGFFVRVGDERKLKKMPALGGSPVSLCDVPTLPHLPLLTEGRGASLGYRGHKR